MLTKNTYLPYDNSHGHKTCQRGDNTRGTPAHIFA